MMGRGVGFSGQAFPQGPNGGNGNRCFALRKINDMVIKRGNLKRPGNLGNKGRSLPWDITDKKVCVIEFALPDSTKKNISADHRADSIETFEALKAFEAFKTYRTRPPGRSNDLNERSGQAFLLTFQV